MIILEYIRAPPSGGFEPLLIFFLTTLHNTLNGIYLNVTNISHSPFNHRLSRPTSTNDELAWQNTIEGPNDKSSPNPTSLPRPDATGLISIPLVPVHWSRRRIDGGYTALESLQDLSTDDGGKKDGQNAPVTSIEFKGLRSDTDVFSPEATPSTTGEVPKIAIRQGLRGNWTKLAPHALAICVTTAVVQLSIRNAYWMDLKPPDKQIAPGLTQDGALNFLQLAANSTNW